MAKTFHLAELDDRLPELPALVEQGGEVIVCRRNLPLARVERVHKPVPPRSQRSVLGCMMGAAKSAAIPTPPPLTDPSRRTKPPPMNEIDSHLPL